MPATRTLIVDDSGLARRGIRAILSGSPLFDIVGEASDGRQGITRTRELVPDLVLMDLRTLTQGLTQPGEAEAANRRRRG